ncbi:g4354 [Coccomyxa elongata]
MSQSAADSFGPVSNETVFGISTEMTLCECEKAQGAPNGLSCDKEGWFISSFEREGSWLSGGGLVPLSHAVCCRPCLPTELPKTQAPIPPDASAVAVMSIGCHASSGNGPWALRCEQQGSSVVTGWEQAVLVSSSIDAYYPLGGAACCTPSLLLETGDAWEFERCDCVASSDINCGGLSTHRLLFGFDHWRITRTGEFVPIGPAQCCKMCLSDTVHPIDSCDDLNFCSGHGICTLGSCQCRPGWAGPDCGMPGGGINRGLPQWLVSVIIMSSCATLSLIMLAVNRLVRFFQMRNAEMEGSEAGEQLREPLVLHIDGDDEGSVGDEDTTDGEDSGDERASNLAADLNAEAAAADAAAGTVAGPALEVEGPEEGVPSSGSFTFSAGNVLPDDHQHLPAPAEHMPAPAAAADGSPGAEPAQLQLSASLRPAEPHPETTSQESASPEPPLSAGDLQQPGADSDTGVDVVEKERRRAKRDGCLGVPGRECNVCMIRCVQVALIPCGHACMCRRCSRRLTRCPVCRKEILRRQRLYI